MRRDGVRRRYKINVERAEKRALKIIPLLEVDLNVEGYFFLHLASGLPSAVCLKAILDRGDVELDLLDKKGTTPLGHACNMGRGANAKVRFNNILERYYNKMNFSIDLRRKYS